ncbi:hypothetical protein J6590_043007 [Homalodisca vitripennis]|nr:hypothetical protein J6590_043007 [Homalodisca vitripennis]
MEFQPTGYVHVKLVRPGGEGHDWYRYNKVTTCVHNLFSGQRWVDQYGELKISSGNITCKLTFVKVTKHFVSYFKRAEFSDNVNISNYIYLNCPQGKS